MPVFFYTFDTGLLNFVPGDGHAVFPANDRRAKAPVPRR